jgi:hypothetical protein
MNHATRGPHELAPRSPAGIEAAPAGDGDVGEVGARLSTTTPAWQRDVVAVSARVRALLQTLRPIVIGVLTFWDHALRSVRIGGRRLEIDPSGSYRRR